MLYKKNNDAENLKITWVSFLIFDYSLYKTTQIEILKHLCERGHCAYLLVTHSKQKPVTRDLNFKIDSVPMRYFPVLTPFIFAMFSILFFPFYVIKRKPKVVVLEPNLNVLLFVWKPLLKLLNSKIVLDVRSTPVELVNLRRQLTALWFNVSIAIGKNVLDGITTLTLRMKKELCARFGLQEDRVGVWTSGVSTSLFDPKKYDGSSLRKSLSLVDKFIVFYHGTITMNRGILETIKAIRLIKDEIPNVIFFVLGAGGSGLGARAFSVLKDFAKQCEVLEYIKFHSPVPYNEVPEFISMSDICIVPLPDLPHWRNQCPLKLLEYLAMNKPIIVTDIPANRDVLGTSKCAIYVRTADPNEIAKAITYTYKNHKILKEWCSCGKAIVEEKYSWAKVAEDLEFYLYSLWS